MEHRRAISCIMWEINLDLQVHCTTASMNYADSIANGIFCIFRFIFCYGKPLYAANDNNSVMSFIFTLQRICCVTALFQKCLQQLDGMAMFNI